MPDDQLSPDFLAGLWNTVMRMLLTEGGPLKEFLDDQNMRHVPKHMLILGQMTLTLHISFFPGFRKARSSSACRTRYSCSFHQLKVSAT